MPAKIPSDKIKHFVAGAVIAIICIAGLHLVWPSQPWRNAVLVIGVTVVVGFGFEVFSLVTRLGHADWVDGIATVLGGIAGTVLTILLLNLL